MIAQRPALAGAEARDSVLRPPGCRKLVGGGDTRRIRIGDCRVVHDVLDDRLVVMVARVAHRREAYRRR